MQETTAHRRRRTGLPRALVGAVGLAIGLGLIGLWLRMVDLTAMRSHLREVSLPWLALGTAAFVASWFLRSQRWRQLLSPVQPLAPSEAYGLMAVAMACNLFLPVRTGELAIGVTLQRRHRLSMPLAVSSLAVDKVCDLLATALLLTLGLTLELTLGLTSSVTPRIARGPIAVGGIPQEVWGLTIAGLALAGASVALLFALARRRGALWRSTSRLTMALPPSVVNSVQRRLQRYAGMASGLSLIAGEPVRGVAITALTVGATALDVFSFYGTFRAFGAILPPASLALGATLFMLSSLVPGPPGRLGSYEVAMLLVFSGMLGLPRELVAAHAAVRHGLLLAIVALMGALAFGWLGMGQGVPSSPTAVPEPGPTRGEGSAPSPSGRGLG